MYLNVENVSLHIPVIGNNDKRLFKKDSLSKTNLIGGQINNDDKLTKIVALNKINFNLETGDRVALIGHNGAGKTTLLRVLAGIFKPTIGHVKVAGNVGCLLDSGSYLIEEMTGIECIDLFLATKPQFNNSKSKITEEIIEFANIGEFINFPIRTYSSGMRLRLASSLVTSISYDILLVDEGIGGGDSDFQSKLRNRLDTFIDHSPILVFASHSNELLNQYCTKGLVLTKGEMSFFGPLDESLNFYEQNYVR